MTPALDSLGSVMSGFDHYVVMQLLLLLVENSRSGRSPVSDRSAPVA